MFLGIGEAFGFVFLVPEFESIRVVVLQEQVELPVDDLEVCRVCVEFFLDRHPKGTQTAKGWDVLLWVLVKLLLGFIADEAIVHTVCVPERKSGNRAR